MMNRYAIFKDIFDEEVCKEVKDEMHKLVEGFDLQKEKIEIFKAAEEKHSANREEYFFKSAYDVISNSFT